MIIILKTYSEEEKTPIQEIKDTVSDLIINPVTNSVDQVKEYLPDVPESRFRKVVNQYRNWWKRSRKQNEDKKS